MASLNTVALVGRLTRDMEFSVSGSGKAFGKFALAVDDGWGENKHTSFFDVTIFGKTAEALRAYLKKGKQIGLAGSLKQEQWQTKDGEKRSRVVVIGRDIQLIGGDRGERPSSDDQSFEDDLPF